jgi:hypothetical protein
MGLSRATVFAKLYRDVEIFIKEEDKKKLANTLYDASKQLDIDDWDGTSQLEIDGRINQNLSD